MVSLSQSFRNETLGKLGATEELGELLPAISSNRDLVLPPALRTHGRPVHIVVGRCPTTAKPTPGRSRCDIVARAKVLLPVTVL